ncbi:MAG: hypothetical protein IT450_20785 [Phycisphaerales bacterium]|nr:hypothetical protein [Phycisphaerales bacterium]
MGARWWAVFTTRGTMDASDVPPMLAINEAPLKKVGESKNVIITIREVDEHKDLPNEKSKDDPVANFYGRIVCKGRREWYFEPSKVEHVKTNAKPGPEIALRFKAPRGQTPPEFKIMLSGDEIERGTWELGWAITLDPSPPPFTPVATSKALHKVKTSDDNTRAALGRLKTECRRYVDRMYKRLDSAAGYWHSHAIRYAGAYHSAYTTVTATLKEAAENAKKESFLTSLIFQLLEMASVGALGFFFGVAKGKMARKVVEELSDEDNKLANIGKLPEWFFDHSEDFAKFLDGKLRDKIKEWYENDPNLKLDELDPLRFHQDLQVRVFDVFAYYKRKLSDTLDALDTKTSEEQYTNQDLEALNRAQQHFLVKLAREHKVPFHVMSPPASNIPYFEDAKKPEQPSFQRLLETGLWSLWLPRLARTIESESVLVNGTIEYAPPPPEVALRLREIGVLKRAQVDMAKLDQAIAQDQQNRRIGSAGGGGQEDHFWAWQGGSKKLVDWATGWKANEAVEHRNIFAQTEPPPGTNDAPAGIWAPGAAK